MQLSLLGEGVCLSYCFSIAQIFSVSRNLPPPHTLAMTLQLTSDILSCIYKFSEWSEVGNLLACARAVQFPGVEYMVQTAHVKRLELELSRVTALCIGGVYERRTIDFQVIELRATALTHLSVRVVCSECDLIMAMRNATEIRATGHYLCGECKYDRVVVEVRERWYSEHSSAVVGLRGSCRRCAYDTPTIGHHTLCRECMKSYNQVIDSSVCAACDVHRDVATGFYTRLDREGMYCEQCVGNQAREHCTIDSGIGILERVEFNVMSDVECRGMAPVAPEVAESEVVSSDADSSGSEAVEIACAICNSIGDVYYHNLGHDRFVCTTCFTA
jgi:hypothetical protein